LIRVRKFADGPDPKTLNMILSLFRRCFVILSAITVALAVGPVDAIAQHTPTTNDYGGVGILATRTARFHDDGSFNASVSFLNPYRRYAFSLQAVPWLEATFRYTDIRNRDFSIGGLESNATFQDRGADLKFKLLEEGKWVPQVAVGLQDGLGTGLFSGEYVVASKRYYDLDFSLGIGWGLLGSAGSIKNPLTHLSDAFLTRDGSGGQANIGSLFSGETIGFFGGVQWYTPIEGLVLSAELDGNDYRNDPLGNDLEPDFPVNVGISYRPFDWLEISGGFERGNTAMFRAALKSNLMEAGVPKFDPPPPKLKPRAKPKVISIEQSNPLDARLASLSQPTVKSADAVRRRLSGDPPAAPPRRLTPNLTADDEAALHADVDRLFDGLEGHGLEVLAVEINSAEVRVTVATNTGEARDQVLADAIEVVSDAMPGADGRITMMESRAGEIVRRVSVNRSEVEQAAIIDYLFDGLEEWGFAVESIQLSHKSVTLFVSSAPTVDDGERRAAELVFRSMPVPVASAAIVTVEAGHEVRRVVLKRDDIRRAAKVDQMFDGLEDLGFEVESIELARGRAVVHVVPQVAPPEGGLEAAAKLVASLTPAPADQVVIVGLSAGVEASRVVLKRASSGAASGASDIIEPDLTDNEKSEIALKIFKAFEDDNYSVDAFHISRFKATVFVTPTKFRQYARNVGRAVRVVANNVPDSVEEIEIVTMVGGLEIGRTSVMRGDMEAAIAGSGSVEEIWANAVVTPPRSGLPPKGTVPDDAIENPRRYPTMNWYIRPSLRQHVGGPEGLYLYQIWLAMSSTVELYRGLTVGGTMGKHLVGNLDKLTLTSDSALPRVRSDIKEYLQEGRDGNIVNLQVEYVFQPIDDWYVRTNAGLLEQMFGGAGGEVLYRPFGSRLAVGLDMFRVRQRDYDQRFRFRNYQVTTGHINAYYKLPFWNLLGEVNAGQFLAGDRGTRFGLSRAFDSGVSIGGWATFTNISAEQFGEGSFDKGFYVRVPLELFLTTSTRRGGVFAFRPLTRDGGQILGRSKRLYGIVEEGNIDNLARDWGTFLD
jgi:hypothetical protein